MQDMTERAVEYARRLLDPRQMRLREEVTAVLQQAISDWENKQVDSARNHLEQALKLAQTYHYL